MNDIIPTLHAVPDLDGDGRDELLLEHQDQSDDTPAPLAPPGTKTIDARLLTSTNDYDIATPAATFTVDDPDSIDDQHTLHVLLQDFDGDGLVDLAAQQHPYWGSAVQNQVVQIWFGPLDAHDGIDDIGDTGDTGDTGAGATGDTGGTEPTGDTGGPTSGSTQDTSTTPSSTGDTGGPSTTPADTGEEEASGGACGCQSAPASWWSPWARRTGR